MGIVRHRVSGPRLSPALEPGELVWARIINGLENPSATGKVRPVILVDSKGSQWRAMGLTTNPRYRDGSPRVAIPDPSSVGLRAPGWLWGRNLTWVASIDVHDHIGWVDRSLAYEVIDIATLTVPAAHQLYEAVDEHHAESGPTNSSRGDTA